MFTWVDDDFRFNTKIATHSRVNSSYRGSILISSNYTALAMVTLNTPHQVATFHRRFSSTIRPFCVLHHVDSLLSTVFASLRCRALEPHPSHPCLFLQRSDATQDIDYGSLIITNDYVPV
ncbi:hypothetical protein CF328_g6166 [Tilletia controversa]|nr:hypothetical protein CF328_g6166 [Tilletia controversa]